MFEHSFTNYPYFVQPAHIVDVSQYEQKKIVKKHEKFENNY